MRLARQWCYALAAFFPLLSAIADAQADLEVQFEVKDQPSSSSAADHGSVGLSKSLQDASAHIISPDVTDFTPAASDPWEAYIVHGPADLEAHGQAVLQQATLKRYTYKVQQLHSSTCTCDYIFAITQRCLLTALANLTSCCAHSMTGALVGDCWEYCRIN
jgi:hypothetical protein